MEADEGLEEIDARAFSYCRALDEIRLPSTLTTIGHFAFLRTCRTLQIIAPNGSFAQSFGQTMKRF